MRQKPARITHNLSRLGVHGLEMSSVGAVSEEVAGAPDTAVVRDEIDRLAGEGLPPGYVGPEGFDVVAADGVGVGEGAGLDDEGRHGGGGIGGMRM
jgi:hypothetical protein